MTDPRIIECAKAVWEQRRKKTAADYPDLLPLDEWGDGTIPEMNGIIAETEVCILKWLAQKETEEMHEAGGRIVDNQTYAHDRPAPTLRNAFRAMCAQAAKEIAS